MIVLSVFGRLDCHLCQDMLHELESFKEELGFTVEFVDIDQDKQLVNDYGTRVPVLVAQNKEICHYFLDKQALFQYFEQH